MTRCKTYGQRGVALIMALMLLMLLTALAAALVFVANMETAVNANYRQEQVLYFAAKDGIDEARDRLRLLNPNSLMAPACATANCISSTGAPLWGPKVPQGTNGGVFYVLGGATPATVTPWLPATVYTDDELCHDKYGAAPANPNGLSQTAEGPDVRCIDVPTDVGWYKTATSKLPWAGTSAALPFQWVRIGWKLNGSVDNALGTRKVSAAGLDTNPICWNGANEVLLSGTTDCTQMVRLSPIPGPAATPVYILTSLAANPVSGARRMIQAEVALPPTTPLPYGLFATKGCNAIDNTQYSGSPAMALGNITTDSFDSSVAPYAPGGTAGDIGSNGNISVTTNNGNGQGQSVIKGSINVPNTGRTGICPADFNSTDTTKYPVLNQISPLVYPPPPDPSQLPPTGPDPRTSVVPGIYADVQVSSSGLTMAPGVYTMNSLTVTGGGKITVSPAGTVTLNFPASSLTPVTFTSNNDIINTGGVANNFQINYGGTGTIKIGGGVTAYLIVNAPYASFVIQGGGSSTNLYGAVVAGRIIDQGSVQFHYDRNAAVGPGSNGTYQIISMRDLAY